MFIAKNIIRVNTKCDDCGMEEMGHRLRKARIAAGFTSARKAALKYGWGVSTYGAHENGQNKFGPDEAHAYGSKFRVSAGWLLTGEDQGPSSPDGARPSSAKMRLAPVAGIVRAGLFREAEDFDDFQHEPIAVPEDQDFPGARQVVFIAEGDSMNLAEPIPITAGSRLVCVDFDDLEMPARTGWIVIVERTRDGGSIREWSVKQVEMKDTEVILHPRSSNPRHKPIRVPLNPDPDDGQTVRILALVRDVFARMPL